MVYEFPAESTTPVNVRAPVILSETEARMVSPIATGAVVVRTTVVPVTTVLAVPSEMGLGITPPEPLRGRSPDVATCPFMVMELP